MYDTFFHKSYLTINPLYLTDYAQALAPLFNLNGWLQAR